jgi:hypothetical protein
VDDPATFSDLLRLKATAVVMARAYDAKRPDVLAMKTFGEAVLDAALAYGRAELKTREQELVRTNKAER